MNDLFECGCIFHTWPCAEHKDVALIFLDPAMADFVVNAVKDYPVHNRSDRGNKARVLDVLKRAGRDIS